MATATGRSSDPVKAFLAQQGFTEQVSARVLATCVEHSYTLKLPDGTQFVDKDGLLTEAAYKTMKGKAHVQELKDLPETTLYPLELTALLFPKLPGVSGEAERSALDLFDQEAFKQVLSLVKGTCAKWGGVQDRAEVDGLVLISTRVRKMNGPTGTAYYLTGDPKLMERDWLGPADLRATRAEEARAKAYVLVGKRHPELSESINKRHAAQTKDAGEAGRRLLAGELGTGNGNVNGS